jgi:hypothetical protein
MQKYFSSVQILKKIIRSSSIFFAIGTFSYSNAVYGDVEGIPSNPDFPKAQYPYAQAPDGCSGWQNPREVRDTWGPVNFTEACNRHDKCYYTLGSNWNTCNERYYSDLRAACERDLRIAIRVPAPTLSDPLGTKVIGYTPPEPASLTVCYGIASTYYAGVQVGVLLNVFEEAQEKQRRYESWVASVRNPAPGSLASLHSSCSGDPQSPDCVAAIHRACNQRGAGGGISQEVGNGALSVACFDTKWFGDISINELRTQHPGCDSTGKSQSSDCVAAIHRACNVRGAGGGIAQEVGNGVLGVACFNTKWFGDISIDELRTQHPGCNSTGKSRSSDCVAALHRACNVRGAGGGIAQEVGNGVLGVACFDTKWYGDIPMR